MKKLNAILYVIILILSGCSDSIYNSAAVNGQSEETENHNISLNTIRSLVGQRQITRTDDEEMRDIISICGSANDTLLYICNNENGGWTIYSSDTRVPPIVARCDTGSIADLQKNEAAMVWIQSIANTMKTIKEADNCKLNFTDDEIKQNKAFWHSITNADEYVKSMIKTSQSSKYKLADPLDPIMLWEKYGHYEYACTSAFEEVYDSIPHLISTHWHQGKPYNSYCPYKSIGDMTDYNRSPAGCSAIADAQILYFLNSLYGVPASAPSNAYCHGRNNENYNWDQYDFKTDTWKDMNSYVLDSGSGKRHIGCAPLIAYTGRLLRTIYGDDGSDTWFSSHIQNLFNPMGISCKRSVYDASVVKESLLAGIPVLVGAQSIIYNNLPIAKAGHDFIIDRYKRVVIRYETHYLWVYDKDIPKNDDGTEILLPYFPEKVTIRYSSPEISMIGMNWGQGEFYDKAWYSLTEDWFSGGYNFNIDRQMIYDFKVK